MNHPIRTRQEMKAVAKAQLRSERAPLAGVFTLSALCVLVLQGVTHGLGMLILGPAILVATGGFFAQAAVGMTRTVSDWFNSLLDDFPRRWMGIFWMGLWTVLWSLLLIVPGIIKGIGYSMTPYLLHEYPQIQPRDALELSERMTKGYKADIFMASLSFLGWHFLSAFTFGILEILFAGPYHALTFGMIYQELKRTALAEGLIREEELTDGAVGTVY